MTAWILLIGIRVSIAAAVAVVFLGGIFCKVWFLFVYEGVASFCGSFSSSLNGTDARR